MSEEQQEATCHVKGCDAPVLVVAVIERMDGKERTILLCERHVHLLGGGAIFEEYLEPEEDL